ncbi:F-box domain-containing protein [Mycena sanguinolenta]|uniref:F-box domain-containing protein n=1 Tax=Mycena sanguinolenta TaxID=230812 RepID=A0A8H6YEG4_9AGAR|nr:F-box domain-containing protein [Mycena sanguinolenta]
MNLTGASIRAAVVEQKERTRHCSKAEIERFIEESESKIISLESQICALQELRDHQRACVLALKHILSPIHSLPVELLAEIFHFTLRDNPNIKDMCRVSHVCSDWRQLAHSTPRLWTRFPSIDLYRDGNVPDHIIALLARSAPLSIRISFESRSGPGEKAINSGILEMLRASSRWSSLDLSFMNTTQPPLLEQLAQYRFDSLEEMELGLITDTQSTPPPAFIVPRLRKLSISNLTGQAPQIVIPWAQLTELTLEFDCRDGTLEVLSQCTNLVKADITILEWSQSPEVGQELIHFSRLQSLELRLWADSAVFFDCVSAPVLQELRLDLHEQSWDPPTDIPWTAAHITAFQLRTPNLTRLEFNSSDALMITSDNLVAAIRSAPSLTHLNLNCRNNCVDDAFIRTLHYEDGVPPLVPRLHNLVIDGTQVLTENVVVGMIASRWWEDTELVPPSISRWTHLELKVRCNWTRPLSEIREDYHMPSDAIL